MKIEKIFQLKFPIKKGSYHEKRHLIENQKRKNNLNILELNVGFKPKNEVGSNFDERI